MAAGSGVQTSNESLEFTGEVRWLVPVTTSAALLACVREQREAVAAALASSQAGL
jgi:RNase P/RNase MRP subunit POP5